MNLTQKISQMTPKGADLAATDLIEVSTLEAGSYVTKSITGQELIDAIPAPSGFVPTSRTLTINGVAQDLSVDRSWTIATGLTIGTTPIASGTVGRVLFQGTGNVLQQSANLFWDSTNNRLGIGTSTPAGKVTIFGGGGLYTTTSASLNSDVTMYDENLASYFQLTKRRSTATGSFGLPVGSSEIFCNTAFGINSNNYLAFAISASEKMRLSPTTGNVLINTTTDAGFKLDVNGTARVSGQLNVSTLADSYKINGVSVMDYGDGLRFAYASGSQKLTFFTASGTPRMQIVNSGSVLIGTTTELASSLLSLDSTTRGFLPPRMTTTQRNAIASPAAGLIVYDTTLNLPHFFNGTIWVSL
jgi:hypothetical protein